MTDTISKKQGQRDHAIRLRKSLVAPLAGQKAAENFLDAIPVSPSMAISLFLPIGSEIDTRPLIDALTARSVKCLLPVIVGRNRPLLFKEWQQGQPLVAGVFNTLQPDDDADIAVPDIVVAPLLAFDARGYRMGYGGGYYDRTLQALRGGGPCCAVGYAYEGQLIEKVITDNHDQKLDWVVTEKMVRKTM